ncbi:hypothetical protein [Wenyingzhuangia sp. IMCC45574]
MLAGLSQGNAMVKSVESNRGQLRNRKFLNTDSKDLKLKENELKFNEFTAEERKAFEEKRLLNKKRTQRNTYIVYGAFGILFIVFIYLFNY